MSETASNRWDLQRVTTSKRIDDSDVNVLRSLLKSYKRETFIQNVNALDLYRSEANGQAIRPVDVDVALYLILALQECNDATREAVKLLLDHGAHVEYHWSLQSAFHVAIMKQWPAGTLLQMADRLVPRDSWYSDEETLRRLDEVHFSVDCFEKEPLLTSLLKRKAAKEIAKLSTDETGKHDDDDVPDREEQHEMEQMAHQESDTDGNQPTLAKVVVKVAQKGYYSGIEVIMDLAEEEKDAILRALLNSDDRYSKRAVTELACKCPYPIFLKLLQEDVNGYLFESAMEGAIISEDTDKIDHFHLDALVVTAAGSSEVSYDTFARLLDDVKQRGGFPRDCLRDAVLAASSSSLDPQKKIKSLTEKPFGIMKLEGQCIKQALINALQLGQPEAVEVLARLTKVAKLPLFSYEMNAASIADKFWAKKMKSLVEHYPEMLDKLKSSIKMEYLIRDGVADSTEFALDKGCQADFTHLAEAAKSPIKMNHLELVARHINNRKPEVTLDRHAIEVLAASLHKVIDSASDSALEEIEKLIARVMKAEDNKVSNIVLMSSESERDETVKAIGDVLAIGGSVGDHGQELKVFRKYWDAVKLLTYPDVLLLSTNPPYTTMAVAQSAHDLDRSVGRELETFALEILKCKNYLDSQGETDFDEETDLAMENIIEQAVDLKKKQVTAADAVHCYVQDKWYEWNKDPAWMAIPFLAIIVIGILVGLLFFPPVIVTILFFVVFMLPCASTQRYRMGQPVVSSNSGTFRRVLGLLYAITAVFTILKIVPLKVLFFFNAIGYFVFVCLVISLEATGVNSESIKKLEMVLLVYVLALTVEELSEIQRTKLKDYVCKWTNWCDVIMLLLYVVYFILRFISVDSNDNTYTNTAKQLFGPAAFLTCIRFMYYMQLNQRIGIVQISFSKIIPETLTFLTVLAIFLVAFGVWVAAIRGGAIYSLSSQQRNDSFNMSSNASVVVAIVNGTTNTTSHLHLRNPEIMTANRYFERKYCGFWMSGAPFGHGSLIFGASSRVFSLVVFFLVRRLLYGLQWTTPES